MHRPVRCRWKNDSLSENLVMNFDKLWNVQAVLQTTESGEGRFDTPSKAVSRSDPSPTPTRLRHQIASLTVQSKSARKFSHSLEFSALQA